MITYIKNIFSYCCLVSMLGCSTHHKIDVEKNSLNIPSIIKDIKDKEDKIKLSGTTNESGAFFAATILPKLADVLIEKIGEASKEQKFYLNALVNLSSDEKGQITKNYIFKSKNFEFEFSIEAYGHNNAGLSYRINSINFIRPIEKYWIDSYYRNIFLTFKLNNLSSDQVSESSISINLGNIKFGTQLKYQDINKDYLYETAIIKNPFSTQNDSFFGILEITLTELKDGNKIAHFISEIGKEAKKEFIAKGTNESEVDGQGPELEGKRN